MSSIDWTTQNIQRDVFDVFPVAELAGPAPARKLRRDMPELL